MQKGLIWYSILLKENLKKRAVWLAVCAMLLLLYTVSGIRLPERDNLMVGIKAGESDTGQQLLEELTKASSRYRFIGYTQEDKLYDDVQSGRIECAFLFDDRLDQKREEGDLEDGVRYLFSPYTTKGEVAKEMVFAAFFRLYSEQLLKESETEIFAQPDANRQAAIREENDSYLESDLFRLEEIPVKTKNVPGSDSEGCEPIQGLFGMFLLGFMYFANGRAYEPDGKWIQRCFTRRDGMLFYVMQALAAATLPTLAGLALLLMLPASRGFAVELLRLTVFVAVGSVWTAIIAKLSKTAQSFAANGCVMVVACALLYPVFWDITLQIPAAEYIRYLTPFQILI